MMVTEIADRYELLSTLGGGASGIVHEAYDRRLQRNVAIKLIHMPSAEDNEVAEAHERFRREARAAGRLSHRNVVSIYDYGEQGDLAWIVMELVRGSSLKATLEAAPGCLCPTWCGSSGRRFPPSGIRTKAALSIVTSSRRIS